MELLVFLLVVTHKTKIMITLDINNEQIQRAKSLYPFGALNGSITNGRSNIYGALGEVVVMDYYSHLDVDTESTYDYDMIIDGHKVDVKTKHTTVVPRDFYLCSVSDWNTTQACDFYFFVRVMKDMSRAFLLGYMSPKQFYRDAFWKNKGELDVNGFDFKSDGYHIKISDLLRFKI